MNPQCKCGRDLKCHIVTDSDYENGVATWLDQKVVVVYSCKRCSIALKYSFVLEYMTPVKYKEIQ